MKVKWSLALFAITLFVPAISKAQAACESLGNVTDLRATFESSVFKVFGFKNGAAVAVGTATLIHPLGYFVTASHIFDQNPILLENNATPAGSKTYPVGGKVRLRNSSNIQLDGVLYRLRSSVSKPDLALLKATLDSPWSLPYPGVALGWTARADGWYPVPTADPLALMGYPIEDLLRPDFLDLRPVQYRADEGSADILLAVTTSGFAFNGISGSAAVSHAGVSNGVLKKSAPQNSGGVTGATYLFTPTSYLMQYMWLKDLPETPRVATLLSRLQKGKLNAIDRQSAFGDDWKPLELLQIASAITANYKPYTGLDADFVAFLATKCACNGMVMVPQQLYSALPDKLRIPSLPLDSARVALSMVQQLKKNEAPAYVQAALLAASLDGFSAYQRSAKKAQSPKFEVNVALDYAVAVSIASESFPELGYSEKDALARASAVTELDETNPKAWILRAHTEKRTGALEAAASSVGKAVTINPGVADRVRREFRGILGR